MFVATTLCHHYLQENFWLAESTRDTTERAFRYFAQAVGNRDIDRIEPSDGERFKGWMLKTYRSKTTANIYLRSISRVFSWAVEPMKILKHNPLGGIKQFRTTRKPIAVYEDWQVERMIRFAPNLREKGIILTAWTTGLRRGAILNLTLDNIRNGFVYVEPKRNSSTTWEWEPKDKEIRKVPLVARLKSLLDLLNGCLYPFISQKRYARMIYLNSMGMLTERQRKCPIQNFRRTFVTIQRKAFGRQIGDFHRFRKTYTTMMCEKLPHHFVMRLTGHSNLKTMTYYLASRESHFEQARQIASGRIKKDLSDMERPQRNVALATTPYGRY